MRKNLFKLLALTLCLALICPAALAQESSYELDVPSAAALTNAFAAGQMVTAEMTLDIDLDAALFAADEEEAALIEAGLSVLNQSTLIAGAGKIDGGVRLTLAADAADAAGTQSVGVNAALDVTADGLALESDLIPGKRVTATWETILALCGLDETEISMIMSLKNVDLEEVLSEAIAELSAQLEPVLEMAGQLAAPYAETIVTYIAGLPIEVREDLNEEGYPPTDMEVSITFTLQDIGTLLTLLCDQLEQDKTMMTLVDQLLAQAEAGVTTAEVIAELRAAAAEMDDTDTPITFWLGVNDSGIPLYVEMSIYEESTGDDFYVGLFLYQDADGMWTAEALGGLYDSEGNPYVSMYLGGSYLGDPADVNVYDLEGLFGVYEGENPIVELAMANGAAPAQDSELPAYDLYSGYSMYAEDGEGGMQMVSNGQARQGLTAAGGEYVTSNAQTDAYYADGLAMTETVTVESLIEPTADGGVAGYYRVSETAPGLGLNQCDFELLLGSEKYDPAVSAAFEQIALESVTNDEMNELLAGASAILGEQKLPQLMNILPQEILEMMEEGSAQAE